MKMDKPKHAQPFTLGKPSRSNSYVCIREDAFLNWESNNCIDIQTKQELPDLLDDDPVPSLVVDEASCGDLVIHALNGSKSLYPITTDKNKDRLTYLTPGSICVKPRTSKLYALHPNTTFPRGVFTNYIKEKKTTK